MNKGRTERAAGAIILSVMIGVFCVETTASPERVSPETREAPSKIETDNAAVFYSNAFALLQYPTSQTLKDHIQATIKNGWRDENRALENILDQNTAALREFQKALSVERCDFQSGQENAYAIQKPGPPVIAIRNLSRLVLLSARQEERRGNVPSAIENYLSLFTVARHVAQDQSLVAKMMAVAIEEEVSAPLRGSIDSPHAGQSERQRIADVVGDYLAKRFPVSELIEPEREAFLSSLRLIADGLQAQQPWTEEQKKKVQRFQDTLLQQAQILADRHYGLVRQAAESDREADWAAIDRELDTLKQELQRKYGGELSAQLEQLKEMAREVTKPDTLPEAIAAECAKLMLVVGFPNVRKGVTKYYEAGGNLKELALLAAGQDS